VLERILREAGLDVGLYTSPDLNDLRERVQVRGQKIPKQEVVRFVEAIWPYVIEQAVKGDVPTFFEAFTAMALWYFDREDVDCTVLEVGIGGRYDATSVVDPVAAAVTSVSLEHTDIIGDTVEEIARDKAQVAPTDGQLVTGATGAALEAIQEETDVLTVGGDNEAREASEIVTGQRANLDVTVAETAVSFTESSISLIGPDWTVQTSTPLLGQHQAVNIGIAATLARQVGPIMSIDVTECDIARGTRNVHWPGRFEVMDDAPLTILDGAHNPDACAKLTTLLDRFDYDDLHLVFGAMRDKDHGEMCRSLPSADRVFLAEPAVERAQDTATLTTVFDRETDAQTKGCKSIRGALDRAIWTADTTDCILIAGSLYVVAEARDHWTRTLTSVQTDTTEQARSIMRGADVPAPARSERADRMVHRTIRLYAWRKEASTLKEMMLSLGGTCAVSAVAADEHVAVILSGTLDQFRSLVSRLHERNGEKGYLAVQITETLGIETETNREISEYPWADRTAVMGILNVTPDSFYDGGEFNETVTAVARAKEMVAAGAAVVDVGGESTRPGADPVPIEEERKRVLPVIERLDDLDTMISVDTRKPAVAGAALDAGADMVNDVTGLTDAAMRQIIADHEVPAVMMHSFSAPVDPGRQYAYDDVVHDVVEELAERVLVAERAGIDRSQLILDPGLGFGKRAAESFALLDRLDEFQALGTPIMTGHSHKSMFEDVSPEFDDRLAPTVAATALATERGADLVRVHDVAANVAAVATTERISSFFREESIY